VHLCFPRFPWYFFRTCETVCSTVRSVIVWGDRYRTRRSRPECMHSPGLKNVEPPQDTLCARLSNQTWPTDSSTEFRMGCAVKRKGLIQSNSYSGSSPRKQAWRPWTAETGGTFLQCSAPKSQDEAVYDLKVVRRRPQRITDTFVF
jgi:hypothetical protein